MRLSNQNLSKIPNIFAKTSIKFDHGMRSKSGMNAKDNPVWMTAAKNIANIAGKFFLEKRPKI